MRTTITLDDDVIAAVDELRREHGGGLSAVVNDLVRSGLIARQTKREPFHQVTFDSALKIDVTNIGEVLDALDEDIVEPP